MEELMQSVLSIYRNVQELYRSGFLGAKTTDLEAEINRHLATLTDILYPPPAPEQLVETEKEHQHGI